MADLARSLLPLTLAILAFVWFCSPRGGDPVREIDPSAGYAYAAGLADFTVLTPVGLVGWRATSSQVDPAQQGGPVAITVGYVTPREEFAELAQGSIPAPDLLDTVLGKGYVGGATVALAGHDWQQYRTAPGESALVLTLGPATVVVTGSADDVELATLASSLQPVDQP